MVGKEDGREQEAFKTLRSGTEKHHHYIEKGAQTAGINRGGRVR
jgi:hypothetical protein